MDNSKNKFQNTFNLGSNNPNDNLISSQNNFNINNISDFPQSNNNQFLNFTNNSNYYYNRNNQATLGQNQIFNNINNEELNNNFRNNNLSVAQNNYYQNNNQKESKEKKNYSKNFPKRINYMPKNLIYQNQNNNIPYQNYPFSSNNQNINQIPNFVSFNENKSSYNYNHNNEIDDNFRNIITEIKNDEHRIKNISTNNKVSNFYSYIFNANIEDVAELLTNENFFKNNCTSEIIDNIDFPKNAFLKIGNNIISCRWKKFYNLKLECYNQIWSKNSISFSLKMIELIPANIGSLEMNFKYYSNTCQNNTLFIIEYILDKGILSEVFKEEFLDLDMNEICSLCEQKIKQKKKEKSHVTSVIINASKEKTWKSITNINKKRYINYMNKYNLYYLLKDEINMNAKNNQIIEKVKNENVDKDYHMKKGDAIFILKNEKENNIFSKIFVQEINEEDDKNEIIFSCDKSEDSEKENENENTKENLKVLNQKIILSLKEITKDICYFEFTHLWQGWVDVNKINSLDLLKVKSLKIFKQFLTQDENKVKKDENDNSILIIFNLLCPTEI